MYPHLIEEMTSAVARVLYVQCAVGPDSPATIAIRKALTETWADKIALVWSVSDVVTHAEGLGRLCSEEQAVEILHLTLHHSSGDVGVAWDTFTPHILELCPEIKSNPTT